MILVSSGWSKPANDYQLLGVTDGDTPTIAMAIRMVSIDTPESAYGGTPTTAQATLERTKTRLLDGTYDALPQELRTYLLSRLPPDAAARHLAAGKAAAAAHQAMVTARLTRPNGSQRKLAVIATGELIEGNGRLLAYTGTWFTGGAGDPLPPRDDPRRRTFNLDMVAADWAATFLIHPSLPTAADLTLLVADAETAWADKRGAWAQFGEDLLLGYEYRAAIKLGARDLSDGPAATIDQAFQWVCVDLRTLTEVGPYGYHQVPPSQRLWIWSSDLDQARRDLPITP